MPAIPATPPAVTISFAPQAVATQHGTHEGQSLNLRPHEIVQATVVEGGMDTVELELNRYRFMAHTRIPLRTGQRLQMQVQDTSPHVELKILNQALLENLFQRLHFFGEKLDLASRLQQILAEASLFSAGQGGASYNTSDSLLQGLSQFVQRPDGSFLAALSGLLGLDTEALLASQEQNSRVANLKTLLLHLVGQQENVSQQQEGSRNNLLQHTELLQLCQARLQQDGVFFLPLPFPFLERGFALMERRGGSSSQGEEQEPEGYSISLCLQLHNLGALEVRMLYEESQLLVRILCKEQGAADFFAGLKEEFKEAVQALPVQNLTVTTGGRDPDKILMEKVLPESEHFVERTV
ncbi:MAG: hypothetical protein K9J48_00910 [Desulfohalobiaceae bacterium]|nr:hypothetical protein [Desulfohalobiaceae bacterium]